MLSKEKLEHIKQRRIDVDGNLGSEMATELLSLREQLTELKALPPIAWHAEDYDTDKSATTYDPEVARRWAYKGWPITELFTAAKPAEDK